MKYDAQLTDLKNRLPALQNILIALPVGSDIDKLAAGLALVLALEQSFGPSSSKKVTVICEDTIRVRQAHLFGIDKIQNSLPQVGGNNFILSLEGVVDPSHPENPVPALENLDWYPEGNNLNLVFHVKSGQTFQPTKITPRYQSGGFDFIFTIGASTLNQQVFSGTPLLNIDNAFDSSASCISEIMQIVLSELGLPYEPDIASNILAGIFDATNNLTAERVSADTFLAVANSLRVGGKKPQVLAPQSPPAMPQPVTGFDLSALIPKDDQTQNFVTPQVVQSEQNNIPSPEERPSGERVIGESEVEPDWLTPKVFKGGSVG